MSAAFGPPDYAGYGVFRASPSPAEPVPALGLAWLAAAAALMLGTGSAFARRGARSA